jgi:glycosyltransferase A (GT-A) superfamily protein (DUF2064 family)
VVIGPAEDGGYYLLGLKQTILLFSKTKTGNRYCFNDNEGFKRSSNFSLETLNDIDFEDLQRSTYNNLISNAISK